MVLEWFRCFEVGRESGFVVNEVVFRRENIGGKEVVWVFKLVVIWMEIGSEMFSLVKEFWIEVGGGV